MAGPVTEDRALRERGRIARAVGVLASATMLSRILGLLRDMVVAAMFGAGGAVDAFFVAFRLPNTLRRLFAEGSLTVAFVPVFVETLERRGEDEARRVGRRAFTLLTVVLTGVVVAGVLAAPLLVRLMAWGFAADPAKFALTVDLTRWMFPFIGFMGCTALAGGMLNALGVFSYPALAPVVLNLCLILAAVGLSRVLDPPVSSLAVGVLAGGVLQLLLQVAPLRGLGYRFGVDWGWNDPAIRRILQLMGPTVFGVAVYQVNILVSTFLASWLPDGSISYLYYAERLFQLPLGVFAVAVGTASLPSLSRLANEDDLVAFRRTLGDALRLTGFIVLPAAVGLWLLAEPILRVLFQRGAFDAATVAATAQALIWYAAALVPVAAARVLAPAFYALQDTRTPVRAAFWSLWVNLAASLVLMWPLDHAGLALATALSSAFNAGYLLYYLERRSGQVFTARVRLALRRMGVCTLGMGAAVWGGVRLGPWQHGNLAAALWLLLLVAGGAGVYLGLARLSGLSEAAHLLRALRTRRVGKR